MPGDHPDPSVVKIGDTYWASATTSNWLPAFPLMKSHDLVHWQREGAVFNSPPAWADYYLWAPEISYENGKVYIYYAAHKKGGNLAVGVASADRPEGPYTDHGPLVGQADGSIDAFPMRDEHGKLYLIWKEDANSVNRPTPIWAQEMNEARTALVGEKTELFRNDRKWEGNLVEGVSILKHNGYFYAFYAASACCGASCTYGIGVARAKNLLGPWEKSPSNPLLTSAGEWTCPGHGTPIEKDGRFFFLHHAYDKKTSIFTGRQGVLTEFRFTPEQWVAFIPEKQTPAVAPPDVKDNFSGKKLSSQWEWSVFTPPQYRLGGALELTATNEGAYLAVPITSGDLEATTVLDVARTRSSAGIAAIGDEKNLIALLFRNGKLAIEGQRDGKPMDLSPGMASVQAKKIYLRLSLHEGRWLSFSYSVDGKKFMALNDHPIDGSFLPPWDRALRVGLISKGKGGTALFRSFSLHGL